MAKVAAAGGAPRASRLDRRKARTRQALIDAAVRLIAEGRGERASIAEITEEADIDASGPSTTTLIARRRCSGPRPERCWNSGGR